MTSEKISVATKSSEVHDNDGYERTEDSTQSTSLADDPPSYDVAAKTNVTSDNGIEAETKNEDERIIAKLRDVVRKCTNPNPAKRPTAQEVLKMLEEAAPVDLQLIRPDLYTDRERRQSKKNK